MDSTLFEAVALLVIAFETGRLVIALVRPGPAYRIPERDRISLEPSDLTRHLAAAVDSRVGWCSEVEVLADGKQFYESELECIRQARRSVHLEAYIFDAGETAGRLVQALAEKAAVGIEVRVLLDAFGSLAMKKSYLSEIERNGGRVEWYQPLRWHTWPTINNRNHQEVIVIDGETAFVGGAGVSDRWLKRQGRRNPWRDTMFRVRGSAIAGLQAAFAQNWLLASGELLAGERHFPRLPDEGIPAVVVSSTPARGGTTHARVLFQMFLNAAQRRIQITTPYFLPDASARREMAAAIRERGVTIDILVPGRHAVPFFTRRCSRRRYGELLKLGANIYEYQTAMMHSKTMVVDGRWVIVGSTNFDPRSFGLNNEVNLVVEDSGLAARLEKQFDKDLAQSRPIHYEEWRRRPWWERSTELLSAILERQQ